VGSNPIFHPPISQALDNQAFGSLFLSKNALLASVCVTFNLKRLNMGASTYPYRKASLNDCKGRLDSRWYIIFYVWDVQQRKMVRKRDYTINAYASAAQRRAYAKQRIQSINELLVDGYHIDGRKKEEYQGDIESAITLEQALNSILEIKKKTFRHSSYLSFKSTLKKFLLWAQTNRISSSNVKSFDRLHAMLYIDHLIIDHKLSGKSINSKVAYMKSLFNELVEREIIDKNPFVKIKKHKEVKSYQNLAYTDEEITLIKNAILIKYPELWTFIQFIYYCYLRPSEIRSLTTDHIHLRRKKIFIPGYISKNGMDAYIDIPAIFLDYLDEIDFFKNKSGLLFTNKSGNGLGKNTMTRQHKEIIDALGLDSRHTLYSWKHTGVIKAYKAGVDIKSIQRQCRHSSIDMTDNYLKSLGLYDNEEFLLKMPEI
jgi:integrase